VLEWYDTDKHRAEYNIWFKRSIYIKKSPMKLPRFFVNSEPVLLL